MVAEFKFTDDICNFLDTIYVIAKLSFNFNLNLVESWDSLIFDLSNHPTPPNHPKKYKGPNLTQLGKANLYQTQLRCV